MIYPRIVYDGPRDHPAIARAMDAADVFVFNSRHEAYGMALAEAAARRLPAVTTDVGAASRLYEHGVSGFVAPPHDAERFAVLLEQVIAGDALRECFRASLGHHQPRSWRDTLDDFTRAVHTVG